MYFSQPHNQAIQAENLRDQRRFQMKPTRHANTIFSDTSSYASASRRGMRTDVAMPRIRSKAAKKPIKRKGGIADRTRRRPTADDVARMRAEAEAAIAEAQKSHERLREA